NAKVMSDILDCEVTDFAFTGLRYGYESYYRKAEECLAEDSAVKMLIFNIDPFAFRGGLTDMNPDFPEIVKMSPRKRRFVKFCGKNFSRYHEAHAAYIEDSDFFVLRDNYTPAIRDRYVFKYCRCLRARLNGDDYERFLKHTEKWSESGIKVVGLRVPDDKESTAAAMKKIAEDGLKDRFEKAGGIWVDVPGEYETVDGSHLTTESAYRYSEALSKELKKVTGENPNR
ncbi:MAG: hypothetical protein J6U98_03435, partial [Abditibacteriota bacterium]|nr:hypothetical protein [Abditibacteriota bacterium]